jgi:cyclopropane-fatty-acyl-phospholipid synthase
MLWCSLILAMLVMLIGWIYEGKTNNAGIVDVLWCGLMCFLPVVYATLADGNLTMRLVAGGLMSLWYLRLFWYLSGRVFSEEEDGRYRYLRQYWGDKTHRNHFFFFQFQALLAFVFTLPVWWLSQAEQVFLPGLFSAVILALVSLTGVTVADYQLQSFRQNPANKGRVCERGLWYFSRHPNYFFEWLHWFCYPLLGIGIAGGGWLWLAPLVMLAFLYFITGIPYTEQQALRSRGEAYRRYQQTTSMFIPWRKKHAAD